jgi:magnesium-transporting ATPase (P-type)
MVYAIDISQPGNFEPSKISNVSTLLNIILPFLTLGGALVFLAMSLWAGFKVITGGDNKEQISQAQKTLAFAVVGLIVVVSSFLLVKLIGFVLGINNILPV